MERSPYTSKYPLPAVRRLRIYAFDPQASVELDTSIINDMVVELPWETPWEDPVGLGPVNDYLEVIDYDPASGVFYEPLDLNDPSLLAQDGLAPSEGRPQFHQQMVFAVAMSTIRTFERALGRSVLWAGDKLSTAKDPLDRNFTRRLRIYPHAIREANAYYSPEKRALLFGYFKPTDDSHSEVDAAWVFTCLSQDIIAHETAHAILHGIQRRSIEPSNIDALAFHEGFADIVALMQHFRMSRVLEHELAQSRGSLRERGLLTSLAEQFGRATGRRGALRHALDLLALGIGSADPAGLNHGQARQASTSGNSDSHQADEAPALRTIRDATEPHERGGYLVAAVFDAFVMIYERRTADLIRLGKAAAREPSEPLQPELITRLASEASKAADHVLRMCVRALDYIPPVSVRFGEYLRAIITADTDLVPDDRLRYRVAFVEAFRKRRITVPGCISMAPDSLLWSAPDPANLSRLAALTGGAEDPLSAMFQELLGRLQLTVSFNGGVSYEDIEFKSSRNLRDLSMRIVLHNQKQIHDWFYHETPGDEEWEQLLGMRLLQGNHKFRTRAVRQLESLTVAADGSPKFEVHSARIARRAGPNGEELHQLIVMMTQRRRAYFDPKEQAAADEGRQQDIGQVRWDNPDFWFRGGATIHVDLRDGSLIRVIRKRIDDDERLAAERAFRTGDESDFAAGADGAEPFAFMHRSLS